MKGSVIKTSGVGDFLWNQQSVCFPVKARRAMAQAVVADRSHGVLSKATRRAARHLGLSGAALAKVVGLSEATVSRLGRGEWDVAPQSKEGQLAALLVRLFRSLDAIVGNDAAKVAAWMGSYSSPRPPAASMP
jgi:hypothetical protein